MRKRFSHLDVRRKLRLVNTVALGAAFFAATLVLIAHLWSSERNELVRNGEVLAAVTAQSSVPALMFNDPAAATEVLGAVARDGAILSAEIYLNDGHIFASYAASGPPASADPEPPPANGDIDGLTPRTEFHASHIDVRLPVLANGERLGLLEMRIDLGPTYHRLSRSLALLLISSLFVVGLALFMLDRLQQAIVEPLRHMLDVMADISSSSDYTRRTHVDTGDEFGALSRAFNHMISQIEERDRSLEYELGIRRHAEDMLRRADVRLRLALSSAGAGSYEWNPASGISNWSDELWALLGLDKNATSPSFESWLERVHPEDREWVGRVVLEASSSGNEYEVEWRLNTPPGQPLRWILDRARPLFDDFGRVTRYVGVSFDISEHKRIERSLEEYRDRLEERVAERTSQLSRAEREQRRLNRALRLLSDCNLTLVHARDEATMLTRICRLVVETGGYLMSWVGIPLKDGSHRVQCIAKSGYEQGYLDQIDISWDGGSATGRGPTGTALREGTTQVVQDCQNHPQMAPWRSAALSRGYQSSLALPLRVDQQMLGALTLYAAEAEAFSADEVQLLEELATNLAHGMHSLRVRHELENYRHRLEDLVEERTCEIAKLNEQLAARARDAESANSAKSNFLATMSHEIRTPLNAVLGLASLLASTPLDRRQRDYADKIELSAQALRALIDDILDFSKIEAGALHLEVVPFSLNNLLRTISAVISVGVQGKAVEALFDVANDIPDELLGDTLRLQQILLNLTSNAIKFTAEGSIVLAVRRLAVPDQAIWLEFAVTDSGIGIPAEQQGRIFEVFAQADSSTSRQFGGTGLGLAISARLADLMGGTISLESTPGQGSTFSFTVPLAPGPSASEPLPLAGTAGKRGRLLIVDDHPLVCDSLARTCSAQGWQVTTAASAEEGLLCLRQALAEDDDYDLMLLDWQMPGTDGIAMLRQAYATPGIGLPLVILMAPACALEQAAAASDDLYLDGMLAKPVTPASLHEAIERAYGGDLGELVPLPRRPDHRLAGMRLLVAEDNDLNRQVMQQILSLAGAEVVMVNDGQAAADVLARPESRFDAVLMDIQMPIMDGYAATRLIRNTLGRTDLPIIAVTAYAQPEDYQRARQAGMAGMAGMVLKPVNIDELLDLLSRERRPALPLRIHASTAGSTPRLDLPGLQADALQAFNGDATTYGDLLRQFRERHANDPAEIRRLLTAGDHQSAARRVHDLAGMAAFLRASQVSSLAVEIEQALRQGKPSAAQETLAALDAALAQLLDSIARFPLHVAVASTSPAR